MIQASLDSIRMYPIDIWNAMVSKSYLERKQEVQTRQAAFNEGIREYEAVQGWQAGKHPTRLEEYRKL